MGFPRTEIRSSGRAGGRAEVSFNLTAQPDKPLHREWPSQPRAAAPRGHAGRGRMREPRAQLVKRAEFPLDEVKSWGFDAKIALGLILCSSTRPRWRAPGDRRRRARSSPRGVRAGAELIERCGDLGPRSRRTGRSASAGTTRSGRRDVAEMALATEDPRWFPLADGGGGGARAAPRPALPRRAGAARARRLRRLVLRGRDAPRSSTGISSPAKLPPEREAAVPGDDLRRPRALAPDYWNVEHGLRSANPT